ncbi:MAG TPA: hypothetical protein VMO81_05810 [Aestuariivirgaceae bacterium]|nr:hypothetical protein [Aestuariivirgaceae bacterium]
MGAFLSKSPDTVALGLLVLSVATLVGGGAFPVAAKLVNPFLGYLIVFVSFPAWALGALAAGLVALRARREPAKRTVMLWGVALAVGNVLAAVVVLMVPFHAS